jgi:hypothetical protein
MYTFTEEKPDKFIPCSRKASHTITMSLGYPYILVVACTKCSKRVNKSINATFPVEKIK